jgi:mannitol/fructose-specific phosphotransferase system IIA component (Ntr-type)
MRLRDLLDEATVKIGLESVDKEECFEEMIDVLVRADRVPDRAIALRTLRARESRTTSGIGKGIAIPHGKHTSIANLTAALGISRKGIKFNSVDGEPVHLVMLLLANANEPGPHVRALAEVSRLIHIPGFYTRAVEANSPAELLDIIEAEE